MEAAEPGHPTSDIPIGWYVHLPFCRTKCGYCDFYSLPTIATLIDGLVAGLIAELTLCDPGRPVGTIFFGGGTPTELPAEALGTLLSAIGQRAGPVEEWTVEANPTSADDLKLETLRRSGVNRLSFGAQSFRESELKVLERLHDPRHIFESVRAARAVGFDNVNLDLMYAIPSQTLDDWRETLRRAVDLEMEHLSCYALMYEPQTGLTRLRDQGRVVACDEMLEAEMFELTIEELTGVGFEHYEISNFARPGRTCRANILYWENREYLGIGPSAVSYLDGERRKNIADVRCYVEWMGTEPGRVVVERERLRGIERAGETAMQMLRLTRGIDVERFRDQTGVEPLEHFAEVIERFNGLDLLEVDDRSIRLTRRGLLLANRVMAGFLVDENDSARQSCA
ncbi:MAG: radical SAM family heme chaperone HemW [Phycisphaerae bacterium]